jgi:hypothetical protein
MIEENSKLHHREVCFDIYEAHSTGSVFKQLDGGVEGNAF